eukprot:1226976-Amphidinium_carterae.1
MVFVPHILKRIYAIQCQSTGFGSSVSQPELSTTQWIFVETRDYAEVKDEHAPAEADMPTGDADPASSSSSSPENPPEPLGQ